MGLQDSIRQEIYAVSPDVFVGGCLLQRRDSELKWIYAESPDVFVAG